MYFLRHSLLERFFLFLEHSLHLLKFRLMKKKLRISLFITMTLLISKQVLLYYCLEKSTTDLENAKSLILKIYFNFSLKTYNNGHQKKSTTNNLENAKGLVCTAFSQGGVSSFEERLVVVVVVVAGCYFAGCLSENCFMIYKFF